MRHEERKGTTGLLQVAAGEGEAQGRGKKAARPRVVAINGASVRGRSLAGIKDFIVCRSRRGIEALRRI